MKHILSVILCLVLLCSCAICVSAVPTDPTGDPTEVNTGASNSNIFFVICLVIIVLGSVYLFIKFRK